MTEFAVNEGEWLTLQSMRAFQIIELFLKFYLTHKPDPTWKRPFAGTLPDFSSEQVDGWSLSVLVSKFREHTDNVALCDRLKAAVADRNLIAHRALVGMSEEANNLLGPSEPLTLKDLRRIDKSTMRLMSELTVECLAKLGRSVANPSTPNPARKQSSKKQPRL